MVCPFDSTKYKREKEARDLVELKAHTRRKAHEIPVVLCVFLSLNYKGKEITRELSEMNTTHHSDERKCRGFFRFLPFFLLIETRASYSVHYRFNERKKEARRKKQTEGNVMVVLFFAFFHSPLPFYNGMEMKREKGKGKNEKKESTKHKGYTSSGSLFFFSLLLLLISCFHSIPL